MPCLSPCAPSYPCRRHAPSATLSDPKQQPTINHLTITPSMTYHNPQDYNAPKEERIEIYLQVPRSHQSKALLPHPIPEGHCSASRLGRERGGTAGEKRVIRGTTRRVKENQCLGRQLVHHGIGLFNEEGDNL